MHFHCALDGRRVHSRDSFFWILRWIRSLGMLLSMILVDIPTWMLSLLLAPFGLVLGSFGNVLIHRLPQEEASERNVVTTPSHCPSCHARIRWYHNIPLFSWLALRGKCAFCGWRIPVRYPLVECLAGLLFAASVWVFPFGTLIWLKGIICGYSLIVLFFTDLTEYILPDAIQLPLMAFGLLATLPQLFWPTATTHLAQSNWGLLIVDTWYNGLQPAPHWALMGVAVTWKASLIGIALGYGGPFLFERVYVLVRNFIVKRAGGQPIEAGMGMGDFKMLAWLGAFWGWGPMLGILGLGAALMLSVALPMMLLRRANGQTMFPFGCALSLATPVIVFFGPALWMGYLGLMR